MVIRVTIKVITDLELLLYILYKISYQNGTYRKQYKRDLY